MAVVKLTKPQIAELSAAIENLPCHTDLLMEVKTSLSEAIVLDKTQAIKFLRIRLEPAVLVNDDIATKRDVYRTILKIIEALGIKGECQPGVSVVETTINTLFDSTNFPAVNTRAKKLYEQHVNGRSSGTIRTDNSVSTTYNSQDVRSRTSQLLGAQNTPGDSISRKLSSVSYTFRDSTHRFSGDYDCAISLYRFKQMVTTACDKYSLPHDARVSVLTDALEGQALDFYLDNIAGQVENLRRAFEILEQRFDSTHSRAQAQSYLDSLTLSAIRESERCSTAQALDKAIKKISSVAPMCGPGYGHESHKSRWLTNMLRHESWAQQCCENRMTMAMDYRTFIAALHAALTQRSILANANGSDKSQLALPASEFYGRHYAFPSRRPNRRRDMRDNRNRFRGYSRRTPEQYNLLKQTTKCLRCGQMGHWRAECPQKQISMTDAINARLKSMGTHHTSAQEILIALVKDEDEYAEYLTSNPPIHDQENDDPNDNTWHTQTIDARPFDAMIANLERKDCDYDSFAEQVLSEETTPTIHFSTSAIMSPNTIPRHMDIPPANSCETLDLSEDTELPRINIVYHSMRSTHELGKFLGCLIDTGAQKSCIGRSQAIAYLSFFKFNARLRKSSQRFRFGSGIVQATHRITITIPTPCSYMEIVTDVVPVDIPFLFGLDIMRNRQLQPLIIHEELESLKHGWRMPLTFDQGHLYLRWFSTPTPIPRRLQGTHMSEHSWATIHLASVTHNNAQPSRKVPIPSLLNPADAPQEQSSTQQKDSNNGIRRETNTAQAAVKTMPKTKNCTPQELLRIHKHFSHASARKLYDLLCRSSSTTPPNTLQQLEAIVASCRTCLEFSPRSVTFRVREADSTLFNHRLTLDFMWLPSRNPPSSKPTRPVLHIVDVGTRFNAATFIAGESSTDVWNSFLMAWSCMYVGMPTSLLVDQGSVFVSDEWKYACGLNQIELVPTGTGSHNSLHAGESYHAYLRRLYNKIHRDFPRLPDPVTLSIAIKAINDTTGPRGLCPTLLVFGTLPQLPSPSRRHHPSQTERFKAAADARIEYERIVNDERIRIAARKPAPPVTNRVFAPGDMVYVYRERLRKYTGPHMISTIHGKHARVHVGENTGPRSFNIAQLRHSSLPNATVDNVKEPRYPPTVLHTEILSPGDPREQLFTEEKRKELVGLLERGAFRIVLREEAGDNPNVVPTRYVLAIKHSQNNQPPRLKARFVIGGHRDRDKNELLHDSRTVRAESIRLVIALATIFGLRLSVADWRQGYIQSKSKLLRKFSLDSASYI